MKYTKTAVAVAVAAGFATLPLTAAAETTLSGLVQVKVAGVESDDDEEQQDANIEAGDVRVGIASEHELGNGLIGYGNLQFNLDDLTGEGGLEEASFDFDGDGSLTDEDPIELGSAATVSSDNVYVGIKGGFGDIRIGEIPLGVEYGQLANDIHDVGTTVPGGVSYTGSFGVFGLGLNFSPEPDADMVGAGVNFNLAGFGIGLGFEDRADQTAFAAGATYAIAGFSLGAHYWTRGQIDFEETIGEDPDGDGVDNNTISFNSNLDDQTNFAVQAGYSIAGVSLGLTYSVLTTAEGALVNADGSSFQVPEDDPDFVIPDGIEVNDEETEESIIRFDAGYDLGGGMDVSTRIQNKTFDDDDADDVLEYRVMLTKTF